MFARAPFCFRRSSLSLAGLAIATLALAACGSSTAKTASNPTVPTTAAPNTSAPGGKAVVMTSQDPKLGVIVTDAQGRTLYTLTNGGKPVACTGMCTHVWPPLLLPTGVTTPTGTNVTGLTVVSMNGGEQVAYRGDPLYRFAGDTKAGDTRGQGITSFGGTWHAASTSAAAPPAATPTTAPPTTSSGSGGYNYG
jgi:predicted lipoprotein with Yx(FWY)xxD motif